MRWISHLRVFIIISLAVILISAAVIFSVLRAVLPHATGYKNEIQQEISRQIGLPVEITSIDAAIDWFSPRLKLIGVSVFDEKSTVPLFNFDEAFVELDVLASILRAELIVANVGLIGADISIERLTDNEWLIQGVLFSSEGSSELPEEFLYMLLNSDYLLHDSNIYYQDHTGQKLELVLSDINIDVNNHGDEHDIRFSMELSEDYGGYLAVMASLRGDLDDLDGDVFAELTQLKLRQWNQKFNFLKSHDIDAVTDISIWLTLRQSAIDSLLARLSATALTVKNNATGKNWQSTYLSTDLRYVVQGEHKKITVSDFQFGESLAASWQRPATLIASDDDEYYHLSADFLRISDLQSMLEVVLDAEQLGQLEKVSAYGIAADLYNLELRLPKQLSQPLLLEKLYVAATLHDFAMTDAEHDIRLRGIDASIEFEHGAATIDLFTETAEIEMAKLFRQPLSVDFMQGTVNLVHDEDQWFLHTDHLQVKNSHIDSYTRFDIALSADSAMFIDAQTDFYNAYAKYTELYLPVGVMEPKLISWLDSALVDGYVPSGKFILHGELQNFPYSDNDGVFQVLFTASDVDLQFLPSWPQLSDASARIKFDGLSLVIDGASATTHKAALYNGHAHIDNLLEPHLQVRAEARASTQLLQDYVWSSPLDKTLGDALRLFQFSGNSELELEIDVPLHKTEIEVTIDGHLDFIDGEIYYPALGYTLSSINGVVDFTQDTLFADAIGAKVRNRPVTVSVFTRETAAGNENVFQLDGQLDADYLLQHYDWIPDDWVSGASKWSINVTLPSSAKDSLLHISATSPLQGVSFLMSDKVRKAASEKLDFSADIDVLSDNGLHIEASAVDGSAKDIVKLYAVRDDQSLWSFDIRSDYLGGKGEFSESLAKASQVKLDLDQADLHALFVSESRKQSEALKPADFPSLSWRAKKILWDEWQFTDVNLETSWHKHGMLINKLLLQGPAMIFDAHGSWLTSWRNTHETVLQGTISSDDLGATLEGLGFQRSVDRSRYQATFETKWPAEPYAFNWAKITGRTSFEMSKGEMLEVEPGAGGRLLGLLNILKLTSRLAFDFDDVYRKGFSFDSVKGDFEFVNGEGSLKRFDLTAPAADINMFGRIGIADRDYALLMRVEPHTSSLTFAGGALLGGVVVGAGLALMEKVFDFDIIGDNVYSITGSWDDPQIEKINEKTDDTTENDDF